MAVSRNQLVFCLVALCWLLLAASGGVAAEADTYGCLACHGVHDPAQPDCVWCHGGNPASERGEIAHHRLIAARFASFRDPQSPQVLGGEQQVKSLGCRRCHTIGGEGNRLATDLDQLAPRVTPERREQALESPVLFMPNFHLGAADRATLVTYLLAAQLKVKASATPPKIVHFSASGATERVFDKQCGACHQLLSARWGALGHGNLAPNLSGLLSPFYPTPPKKDASWTEKSLRDWLKNPRSFRPKALMPPVVLSAEEASELLKEFAKE